MDCSLGARLGTSAAATRGLWTRRQTVVPRLPVAPPDLSVRARIHKMLKHSLSKQDEDQTVRVTWGSLQRAPCTKGMRLLAAPLTNSWVDMGVGVQPIDADAQVLTGANCPRSRARRRVRAPDPKRCGEAKPGARFVVVVVADETASVKLVTWRQSTPDPPRV